MATVDIKGKGIYGHLLFLEKADGSETSVTGFVHGLTDGEHGIHIHESGDLTQDCHRVGSHFNTRVNTTHGSPHDSNRHTGDLGNIVSMAGKARLDLVIEDLHIGIDAGPTSILGRAVVIHADQDDLGLGDSEESSTTGNSGKKIACGRIVSLMTMD
jgi:Cu-Zn family superoxide dismutase